MDAKEIAGMSDARIQAILTELRVALRKQRFSVRQKQLKNVRNIRFTKRDIARVLTEVSKRTKA